jgi:CRISPR-associated protein Cmr6
MRSDLKFLVGEKEKLIGDKVKSDNASLAYDVFATENDAKFRLDQNAFIPKGYPELYSDYSDFYRQVLKTDPNLFLMAAKTAAPLAVGLGDKNVYETGLCFSKTLGVPIIPGSSIKGAMRRAAAKMLGIEDKVLVPAKGSGRLTWDQGRTTEDYLKGVEDREIKDKLLQWCALFGSASEAGIFDVLQAIPYLDAKPRSGQQLLMVDVVTVHHPHYYQTSLGRDHPSPSDRDDPTPIQFLSVRPGVEFLFAIRCEDPAWMKPIVNILRYTLQRVGLGAKTNAGYGRFKVVWTDPPETKGGTGAATQAGKASPVEAEASPSSAAAPGQAADKPQPPPKAVLVTVVNAGTAKAANGRSCHLKDAPPDLKAGEKIWVNPKGKVLGRQTDFADPSS